MDVWVLTRESGSYSDYSMSVVAVAETAEAAMALANEPMQQAHAAMLARLMELRQDWAQKREVWRAEHLAAFARRTSIAEQLTASRHRAEECFDCRRYALSAEEAWPMAPSPPTAWDRSGDGWAVRYDDDDYTVTRFPLNGRAGRRFVANPLNADD